MEASNAMLSRAERLFAVWELQARAGAMAARPMSSMKREPCQTGDNDLARGRHASSQERERCNLKLVAEDLPGD